MERVRAAVARGLESGAHAGPAALALSRAWGAVAGARVARPLSWSPPRSRDDEGALGGVHVVAVGGATLGGSGKTPLAIACAAALAAGGARVALVGHAYRAAPRRPRVVMPDDDVRAVGDEAVLAARALAPLGGRVAVVVATTRQAAIDRALADASILVLDGVAQTAPRRASLALLALDAAAPWGASRCPPAGDLRAPVASLLRAADLVVSLRDDATDATETERPAPLDLPGVPLRAVHDACVVSRGAWLGSALLGWRDIAAMRVGLFTTLARPARVVAFLERRGVYPVAVLSSSDHAPPGSALLGRARALSRATRDRAGAVDLWLTTAKCALQLEVARRGEDHLARATIDHSFALAPSLVRAIHPTLCAVASDVP